MTSKENTALAIAALAVSETIRFREPVAPCDIAPTDDDIWPLAAKMGEDPIALSDAIANWDWEDEEGSDLLIRFAYDEPDRAFALGEAIA